MHELVCEVCGYESDERADFDIVDESVMCNDCSDGLQDSLVDKADWS